MEIRSNIYTSDIKPPKEHKEERYSVGVICFSLGFGRQESFIGYWDYKHECWRQHNAFGKRTCSYWIHIPNIVHALSKPSQYDAYQWVPPIKSRKYFSYADMLKNKIKISRRESETYSVTDAFNILFDCCDYLLDEKIKQEKAD